MEIPTRACLTYHAITQTDSGYSYDLPESLLREHLVALRNSGLDVEVSFDDGHATHFTAAARVLEELSFKGIFFVTLGRTGNNPRFMDWNHLAELAQRGHQIGLHGWSHAMLTACNEQDLQRELEMPRNILREKLGLPAAAVSMPGGRWNDRVLKFCAKAGYAKVYTSDGWRRPFSKYGLSVMGRLNVTSKMTAERLLNSIQDARSPRSQIAGQTKAALQRALGDSAYHKLWSWMNGYAAKKS